jgi:hypothetical protein
VVIIEAILTASRGQGLKTSSILLPNGDVHHFFPLSDGVHHSFSRRFRGRFDEAMAFELSRPGATIVGDRPARRASR